MTNEVRRAGLQHSFDGCWGKPRALVSITLLHTFDWRPSRVLARGELLFARVVDNDQRRRRIAAEFILNGMIQPQHGRSSAHRQRPIVNWHLGEVCGG